MRSQQDILQRKINTQEKLCLVASYNLQPGNEMGLLWKE